MNFLPSIDGQTGLSIAIGAFLTLFTFWLAYRRTIGAKEERVGTANRELVAAVIKRIAVERQDLPANHYLRLREAKAYERGIDISRLLPYSMAKAVVFSEIVDNNFLDLASKNEIITLLDQVTDSKSDSIISNSPRSGREYGLYAAIGLGSILVGVIGSYLIGGSVATAGTKTDPETPIKIVLYAIVLLFTLTATNKLFDEILNIRKKVEMFVTRTRKP